MLISPAFAHGGSFVGTGEAYGLLVLAAVAAAVALFVAVERKIRGHRSKRDDGKG